MNNGLLEKTKIKRNYEAHYNCDAYYRSRIGIIAGIRKYYDQFYLKTEVRTVEVINKEDDVHHSVVMSGKVLIPVTTHSYYLYGVNNEKVDVSSSIFNAIKEGDEIQVKCTYVYYKKDDSLHKIEYEYLEE